MLLSRICRKDNDLSGQVEAIRLLISSGAQTEGRSESIGDTPLTVAARNGQLDAMRVLVELGANKDGLGSGGGTPLLGACHSGQFEAVKLLVELGADLSAGAGVTPLALAAAHKEHPEILQCLVEAGATDPNLKVCICLG